MTQSPLTTATAPCAQPLRLAVVGGGPVGLALALLAAERLPTAQVTVFDARAPEHPVAADPRTLALALGSIQLLERLGAWPADAAEPITEVQVSQLAPGALGWGGQQVTLTAGEQGVPMLGAVLRYSSLVAALQARFETACAAAPERLALRLGTPVAALKPMASGVEVDAGIAEPFDLAVVAEGSVFGAQAKENTPGRSQVFRPPSAGARHALVHDYGQTAWVGTVTLGPGAPAGVAVERFTPDGPLALLPLPPATGQPRQAALVWCVPQHDDPVAALSDAQRLAVLRHRLPASGGWQRSDALVGVGPLKHFALGLKAERTLVQGRQVRIGNAAQTLHPVAGQGLNLGLRDAYALVDALATPGALTQLDATLARVRWQRAPDRLATIATTDLLARAFTWRAPGAALARGAALTALAHTAPLRRRLARQLMFGWR